MEATPERAITDAQSVEASKAFCIKPWVHLFVSHFGTVTPCCLAPWEKAQSFGNVNEKEVEAIWNDEKIRAFRLKMLRDERDSRCSQCYENESVGLRSARITTNFLYADKIDWALHTAADGTSAESKPIDWDIRFSNLCNFKCRICGHHSSSQWYDDAKALGLVSHDTKLHRGAGDFDLLLKQLEFVLPHVEEIYFAGGEPLIMEEHYFVLKLLLERKKTNTRLRYATNFSQTTYKGQDVFELWKQFDDVYVYASLDGSGKRGELQRHGQSWQLATANRKRMLEICPDVGFLITSTISVFNVLHLPDFHREWTEQGLIAIDQFIPHLLKYPPELNIRVLPPALKKQAEEKINQHVEWMIAYAKNHPPKPPSQQLLDRVKGRNWTQSESVTGHPILDVAINEFRNSIPFMHSQDDSHLLPKFREMSAALDRLRGENTQEVFPELGEIWRGSEEQV